MEVRKSTATRQHGPESGVWCGVKVAKPRETGEHERLNDRCGCKSDHVSGRRHDTGIAKGISLSTVEGTSRRHGRMGAKTEKGDTHRRVLRRLNLGTRVRRQGSLSGVDQMSS